MRKKFPPVIICVLLLVLIAGLAALLFMPSPGQAITYQPKIKIPGGPTGTVDANTLGAYISAIYKYAIGIVGILATVALMFGGVIWITAGGSSERIGNAKAWIGGSLTGLVLVFASYMILNTVNPDLVKLKPVNLINISQTKRCCSEKMGPISGFVTKTDTQMSYSCDVNIAPEDQRGQYGAVQECTSNKPCILVDKTYQCSNSLSDPACLGKGGTVIGAVNKQDPNIPVQCNTKCLAQRSAQSYWFNNDFFYCCICKASINSGYCLDHTSGCYPMQMTWEECCVAATGDEFCTNASCSSGCLSCH